MTPEDEQRVREIAVEVARDMILAAAPQLVKFMQAEQQKIEQRTERRRVR